MSSREPAKLFNNCPWETEVKSETIGNYRPTEEVMTGPVDLNPSSTSTGFSSSNATHDIFKAFIPWFIYKPPYGFPREVNPLQLRQFAKNPYIFAIKKTIADQVASIPFGVELREEFLAEGQEEDVEKKKQMINFFDNPNGNDESFEHILRSWVFDVCDIGNFVGVKVFDMAGRFTQLFARDAGTFLKNPDIYGYMGDRAEFVPQPTQYMMTGGLPTNLVEQMAGAKTAADVDKIHGNIRSETYDSAYRDAAAYFQYGWTAGARPVPFGRREIMWGGLSPRTNSIYEQAPIEVLYNQILTLVYGSEYNLDFYLNNNLPNGILTIKGCTQDQATGYRQQMENTFMENDEFGNFKKKHFKVPITGYEAAFTQMQMSSKEMEVIEQQKWFTKLAWSVFGVTAEEMGFTEDSNKAISDNQAATSKRKAIKPFLKMFEYIINTQLMPEFDCPEYEFKFTEYDIAEEMQKRQLWQLEINMGVRSPRQIAVEEMGISEEDFDKESERKMEEQERQMEMEQGFEDDGGSFSSKESAAWVNSSDDEDKKPEEKEDTTEDTKKKKEEKKYSKEKPEAKALYEFEKEISLNELESSVRKALSDLRSAIEEDVAMQYQSRGLHNIKGFVNVKAIFEDTLDQYKGFFKDAKYSLQIKQMVGKEFTKGVEELEKKIGRNLEVSTSKSDELGDFVFRNIVGMNEELINNLQKQITLGVLNQESYATVKTRIASTFNIAENRAVTITRTEMNRAANMGNLEAARESGIDFVKKWDAHLDARTSAVCRALDGQIVGLNEKWSFEGKEYLMPPAHPNCRSTVLFLEPEELEKKNLVEGKAKYIKRTGQSGNFKYQYSLQNLVNSNFMKLDEPKKTFESGYVERTLSDSQFRGEKNTDIQTMPNRDTVGAYERAKPNIGSARLVRTRHGRGEMIGRDLTETSANYKKYAVRTKYGVKYYNKQDITVVTQEAMRDGYLVEQVADYDMKAVTLDKPIEELTELELKAKYIKRTGHSGNYRYFYRDNGNPSRSPSKRVKPKQKQSTEMTPAESVKLNKKFIDKADSLMPKEQVRKLAKAWDDMQEGKDTEGLNSKIEDGKVVYNTQRKNDVHKPVAKKYQKAAIEAKTTRKDKDGKPQPHVIFMAGTPGSGKTFATRDLFDYKEGSPIAKDKKTGETYMIINADDIKSMIPEYDNGDGASLVHEESSMLSKLMISIATTNNANVIFDGTLTNAESAYKKVGDFKQENYTADLIFVDSSVESSIYSAMQRQKNTGRATRYQMIAEAYPQVAKSVKDPKLLQHWEKPPRVINNTRSDIQW